MRRSLLADFTELVEFVAPLLDLNGGERPPSGLAKSLPGATVPPLSSRVADAAGVGPLGVAMRRPLSTARTSLIARACSRGDLSMLIWSTTHIDIGERAVKARPRAHVGVFPLGQVHQAANVGGSENDSVPSKGTTKATGIFFRLR